jgi:hypothetical protein
LQTPICYGLDQNFYGVGICPTSRHFGTENREAVVRQRNEAKPTKRARSLFGSWHCAPSAVFKDGLKMTPTSDRTFVFGNSFVRRNTQSHFALGESFVHLFKGGGSGQSPAYLFDKSKFEAINKRAKSRLTLPVIFTCFSAVWF